MRVNGLILAAGMSKRMQQFKPLMKIGDRTMIEIAVDHMLEAQVQQIVVVLGYRGAQIRQVLLSSAERAKHILFAYNENYETTQMLYSVQAGLSHMQACDAFFVAPGDMPAISASTYERLQEAAQSGNDKVIFPTIDGYRKHPPLVAYSCKEDILQFKGQGLRDLWNQYEGEILEIPLRDQGCTMDADYQEDYQNICKYLREREA